MKDFIDFQHCLKVIPYIVLSEFKYIEINVQNNVLCFILVVASTANNVHRRASAARRVSLDFGCRIKSFYILLD